MTPIKRRSRGVPSLIGGIASSWVVGCVVVRVGLDGADSLPYSPVSEWIYLAVAVLALTTGIGGTVLAARRYSKSRRATGTSTERKNSGTSHA